MNGITKIKNPLAPAPAAGAPRTRHRCTRCGTPDAYQGYWSDECVNPKCPLYSVSWATNTARKATGGLATDPWDPARPYRTSNEFWAVARDTGQLRHFRKDENGVWHHLTLRKVWGGPRVTGNFAACKSRIIIANYHVARTLQDAINWTR